MALDLSLPSLIRASSGAIALALAAYLALAKPRTSRTTALALYLAPLGMIFIAINLARPDAALLTGALWLAAGANLLAAGATTYLAWSGSPDRRVRVASVAFGLLLTLALLSAALVTTPDARDVVTAGGAAYVPQPSLDRAAFANYLTSALAYAAQAALCLELALRHPTLAGSARRENALIAAAIGIFISFFPGGGIRAPGTYGEAFVYAMTLAGVIVALVWSRAAGGDDGRLARNVALVIVVASLARFAVALFLTFNNGANGIARTIALAILAYALVRAEHRGGLAMASLAAFFIVAQVAQNFLSASYGLLLGGVVAGVLLFALTPVQRAIERRARRGPGGERTYRDAVRFTLRDGRIGQAEELHLARLADDLGITAARAVEIRHEVEAERVASSMGP